MAPRKDTITPKELADARRRAADIRKAIPMVGKNAALIADLRKELARHEDTIARFAGKPSAAARKALAEAERYEKEAKSLRARAAAEAKKGSGFASEYSKGADEAERKAAAARKRAAKGTPPPLPKPAPPAPVVGQGPLRPGETRAPDSYVGATPRATPGAPAGPAVPTGFGGSPRAPAGGTAAPAAGAGEQSFAPADPAEVERLAQELYSHMSWALDDPELGPVLRQAASEGWDEARLKGAVFKTNWFRTHGTHKIQTEVRKLADEYLVTLTDDDAKRWGMQIVSGQVQPTEFNEWAKQQAKSRYTGLAGALDRGVTVRQYASQYLMDAAATLELPVESLNLKDPKWMRAIEGDVHPKTGERVPMSRAEWQKVLKTDSIYGYDRTNGAIAEASAFVAKLEELFGAR